TIPTTVATSMPLNTVVALFGGGWGPRPGATINGTTPLNKDTPGNNNPRHRREAPNPAAVYYKKKPPPQTPVYKFYYDFFF
ncbi:hypothetical protein ACVGW4_01980, partial [Enterobacter hormaechei]